MARFKARCVKRRWGMVHRGGVMVCTRWWWWGCAFAKREVRSGQAKKNRNRAAVARFRAAVGCKRWRGELWGYIPPSRAKLKGRDGEVVWVVVLVVLTWHPFCFSYSSHPLHSLSTHSQPSLQPSDSLGKASLVVGCMPVVDERDASTCCVWQSFKL